MQEFSFKGYQISDKVYQLYVVAIITILFAVNGIVNKFTNGDILTLVIWILFLLLVYVKDIKFLLKYSFILLMQCSNILGIYICESKILYLTELDRYSEPFGSLLLATVSHYIFFCTLWFLDTWIKQTQRENIFKQICLNKKILWYIGAFVLSVSLIAFLHAADNPAFKLGLDRFRYSEIFLQGIWKLPDKMLGFAVPLIGILYIFNYKKLSLSILLTYSLYLFCIGNKFGGFLNLFFMSVPVVYALNKSNEVLKKTFTLGIVVSTLMVGIVFFHNYLTFGLDLGKNFSYLEQRFAQQGQLWWAQYGKEKDTGYKIYELHDEFNTYFAMSEQPREEWNHGIYKVMRNVTPQDIYDNKIASGSRYASATLASIYYYFKDIGLVVGNIFLALLFWMVTTWYYSDYIAGDVIGTVISGKFFIWMHMVATQADFHIIFSWKALLGILVYVVYRLVIQNISKQKGQASFVEHIE